MTYPKLRGAIREKFGTQAEFACKMPMNASTLSSKLNSKTEWSRIEIERACALLGIPLREAHSYFFCTESWERATK